MTREIRVGAAQLGPIARDESRASAVARMIALLDEAAEHGCKLVVFPELALTTFFPRWVFDNPDEADGFCETEMPNEHVQPLFDAAKRHGIGFYLGYGEIASEGGRKRRFNTSILVDETGRIVGKYRKVHLPGLAHADPEGAHGNFEKRYFTNGDLGFPVFKAFGGIMGMCLCNDRRWPETYRVMALQGVEMIMLGYNTGAIRKIVQGNELVVEPPHLPAFHNLLTMQAGAYQNCTWVVATAKAGPEEGSQFLGQSCIIAPTGEVVAMARTLGDELVVADCDLDAGAYNRRSIFDFEANRQIRHYGPIANQAGAKPPT